ncbi:MAG: FMN-binding protein, partial [Halomonas sp.]|nr:FMN-binding protein [Halomonas sp.]
GLGDDIERCRSDWITHFDGLRLESLAPEDWAVQQDGGHFDAFTGATITPRAVVGAVHSALQYAANNPPLENTPKRQAEEPKQ